MTSPVSLRSIPNQGFGDYVIPDKKNFHQFNTIEKVKYVVAIVLTAVAFGASVSLAALFPAVALVSTALGLLTVKWIMDLIGVCNQAPPIDHLFSAQQIAQVAPIGVFHDQGNYSALLPKDGVESFEWKCKLIEHAQESIVLSGCYAQGRSLDRVLDLIEVQMDKKPRLNVSLISSSPFHTRENQAKIAALKAKYPDRFSSIGHQEYILYRSPQNKLSFTTNHTKALVIDGGAYFVIGGTGIVSCFTDYNGLVRPEPTENPYGILGWACPEAYRDMDFVFHSPEPNGIGARIHIEMSKLIEIYRYRETHRLSPQQELPNPSQTHIPDFDDAPGKLNGLSLALFCSGPEHTRHLYEEEVIHQIDEAKESLVMAHLFFAPTKKMEKAFIDAANRGVRITILTNKTGADNPILHHSYVARSRYGYKRIFEGKENPNIKIYEYDVPKVTYHKKITIIDGKTVITGSSNLIAKSLDQEDYEIDLAIQSPEFAKQTLQSLEADFQEEFRLKDPNLHLISPATVLAKEGLSLFSMLA